MPSLREVIETVSKTDDERASDNSLYAMAREIPSRSSSVPDIEYIEPAEPMAMDDHRTDSEWSTVPVSQNTIEELVPTTGWGRLLSINEAFGPKHRALKDNVYFIGRQADCQIHLTENDFPDHFYRQISKKHCCITRSLDGLTYLKDLSSNGTFVNFRKIGKNKSLILTNNAEIGFVRPNRSNIVFMYIESMTSDDCDWLPRELQPRFFYMKHLGSGGFAEVKLFVERIVVDGTNKHIAIKKIAKSGIETANPMNEISILRQLCHPCIVQLDEWFDTSNYAYIIMEYVPDGNLNQILDAKKPLDEPLAKLIIFQLATAVQYIHDQNITHRDIKPENILIRKVNDLVIVKLADFGLSKILKSTTQLRTNCGTYAYAAPEVMSGHGTYSIKVDMWAVGIILYVCLCGDHPANGMTDKQFYVEGRFNKRVIAWKLMSSQPRNLIEQTIVVTPEIRLDSSKFVENRWFSDTDLAEKIEYLFGSAIPRPDNFPPEDFHNTPLTYLTNVID